ncbi:anthranilate synthase component I family protein [Nesterenkonia flava]|uniref:Anthranilate synthase component I family protein n=1 Tax=Nesterenkonia flava TaxID=469799 RepID=A0ABU1FWB5_9MICC|nr:anthranilate synthase component I family protein [Nesterenkonia flava]MDR5712975.1 anthranilate synthase component I family protein [Nesterenkonia flava]
MPAPIYRETLRLESAHEDLAADLFTQLRRLFPEQPQALLDSSDHARTPAPQRSRFSILAFSAGAWAETFRSRGAESFYTWLRQAWPSSEADASREPCPFQLGWVGYLGYEHQARFFRATHAVVVDHHTGTAQTQSVEHDWAAAVRSALSTLHTAEVQPPPSTVYLEDLQVRDSRGEYLEKIRAAQRQIAEGNSYEICLTTAVTGSLHGDPFDAYRMLRRANRAPFTQFLSFPPGTDDDGVTLVSTSPERFLQVTPERIARSEPIKGTRPRGATRDEDEALARDLAAHPKDRAENVMIADLVRNDLSVHAVPGSLRTERLCAVESYPSVHQMVSTVSARIDPQTHAARVVEAAFPPGSMTGAPKISTCEILRELETGPRGPYSGAAGYFSTTGACDLSVLIRTLVVTHERRSVPEAVQPDFAGQSRGADRFHLGLGGAITADSDPAAEWAEVITKSRGVLGTLGAEFPGTGGAGTAPGNTRTTAVGAGRQAEAPGPAAADHPAGNPAGADPVRADSAQADFGQADFGQGSRSPEADPAGAGIPAAGSAPGHPAGGSPAPGAAAAWA